MYEKTAFLLGMRVEKVYLDENWDLPIESLMKLVSKGAILFLGYPNNPTANCWPKEELRSIIEINPGITVVDEAYHEFSGKTMLDLIFERDNLIILRTFSKAFGMAGARVGYAISHKRIIERIDEVRLPFNLNLFSEKMALLMLEKDFWVKEKVSSYS